MPRGVRASFEGDGAGLGDSVLETGVMHPDYRHTLRERPLRHASKGELSLGPAILGPSPPCSPPCSDRPVSQMRSSIPVSHIRAVERVDEGAFQLPHVMQVVTQDPASVLHTTYLQCKVRHGKDGAESVP